MRRRAIGIMWGAFCTLAHAELLPIKTYTTADGLASNRIHAIVPDSKGFLWICTPEGLSRFDGTRFVNYGIEEGLPHPAVFGLTETRSGDHWIATARGLVLIDRSGKPRFTTYKFGPEPALNYVAGLAESRSGKMLGANMASIFEWTDPSTFKRLDFTPPRDGKISDIAEDDRGNLWIGTQTGVFVLGAGGVIQSFTMKDGLPGDWVEELLLDSRGRMWAAIRGGLAQFARGESDIWKLENVFTVDSGLASRGVTALKEASDGTLWVGTSQGISRLKWGGGKQPMIENLSRAQGLSDRGITALAEDQAGNIWAGTESAGVMRIGRFGFTTFREQDGLRSDRVWSVLESRGGELLAITIPEARTSARSVEIFDGQRFRNLTLGTFADHSTWGWDHVLLQSRAGEWWAATARGLCRYGAIKAAALDRRDAILCYGQGAEVFRIFEDSKGGIWAPAQSKSGDRLMRWNPETNSVVELATPLADGQKSRDDLVSAFAEDRHGNMWLGLFKGGLYRYNGREFQHLDRSDGVPRGAALAILANESGLWIATDGGGLAHIENPREEHPKIDVYDTNRGLTSNIVQCLVDDLAGHIYAGTAKGVDRLDPRTGNIRHFSSADGLPHGAFHGAVRDKSGALWFATTQGLSRLVPADDPVPRKPRILITELRVGGDPYAVSPLGATQFKNLELQPQQNQLQAEFVGIDYEPGDVVRYSYKLEGADSSWSAPRGQHTINYAALAPGTYRFLVKAVTSEGVDSDAPAEIDFTVLPPVWRRAWFVGLALLVVAGLVLAGHRYRMAQIVSLERMRTAIAMDLHDDIGASLSQIAILSEVARVSGNGRGPGEPLDKVATLARELVDSMGDIVWSIRSEPRGIDSLVRRMREFALDVLESQGIDFELRTRLDQDNAPMSLQARRQLFLMFKECIHNAARHSRCAVVVAELKVMDRDLILTVADNGIGINGAKLAERGGLGISGIQRRAEGLGGRAEFQAGVGGGCIVEICVPVRRSALSKSN